MPIRFRKAFKIAPGVRVTVGKKSASVSAGGKGIRRSYSTSGRRTTSVGVPGSGMRHESSTKVGCLSAAFAVLCVAVILLIDTMGSPTSR